MITLRIPIATYRLQLSRGFRFKDSRTVVPYLHRLGITDLYASPIFRARQGSSHGYDITDPSQLNPELGNEQDFEALVRELKAHGMGLILDIVPNHMAASVENQWWMDVLENGQTSPYATFFDIHWNPIDRSLKNKVLLPILDSPYREALENQEFALTLEEQSLSINYHGYKLPLNIKSYFIVISHQLHMLEAVLGADHPSFQQLIQLVKAIEHLPSSYASHDAREAQRGHLERQQIKKDFWHLVNTSPEVKSFLSANVALFNSEKGNHQGFDLLDRLLSQQSYQPAFWKTALGKINYRRFFDINDLIGITVDDMRVFKTTHTLILRLVSQGKVTGLRIDHIDGLNNPLEYMHRLQRYLARRTKKSGYKSPFYIVVEKILSSGEILPEEWPVFGTTGYDFLNVLNNVFVDENGIQDMKVTYARLTGSQLAFEDIVYQKRKQVMEELFASEIHSLVQQLAQLSQQDRCKCNLPPDELKNILIEVTACLPIYRTYTRTQELSPRDRGYLESAIEEAQRRNPTLDSHTLDFVQRVLFLDFPNSLDPKRRAKWLRFIMQWQQCTGAVMAKGVEDTAFYNYNSLISLNEVGGNPGGARLSIEAFHQHNLSMQAHWPYTLNTTSTHDTKRGEDVRARLNVLSEMPQAWESHLANWMQWNRAKKPEVNGQLIPDPNLEVLLYQTLIGAWPLSDEELPEFKKRVRAYMFKAAREAKAFTTWLSPNPDYESALIAFVDSILKNPEQNEFLMDLLEFQRQVAYYGILNSLAQVLLKIVSPGVPDFYQGTELWDFSLVDPDNRRPVDFEKRISFLDKLMEQESEKQKKLTNKLLHSWENGQIKLYVTYKTLNARRAHREIFMDGDYIPIKVQGIKKEHVFTFARHRGNNWALIAVPRLSTRLVPLGELPLGRQVWGDDILILPDAAQEHWLNIFTGETISLSSAAGELPLADIFHRFPIALLISSSTK